MRSAWRKVGGWRFAVLLVMAALFIGIACTLPGLKTSTNFVEGTVPPIYQDIVDPLMDGHAPRLVVFFDRNMNTLSFNPRHDLAISRCPTDPPSPANENNFVCAGESEILPPENFIPSETCRLSGNTALEYCFRCNPFEDAACMSPGDTCCQFIGEQHYPRFYIESHGDTSSAPPTNLAYIWDWTHTANGDTVYDRLSVFFNPETLNADTTYLYEIALPFDRDNENPLIGVNATGEYLTQDENGNTIEVKYETRPGAASAMKFVVRPHDTDPAALPFLTELGPANLSGFTAGTALIAPRFPPHEKIRMRLSEPLYFLLPVVSYPDNEAENDWNNLFRNQDGQPTINMGVDTLIRAWADKGLPVNTTISVTLHTEDPDWWTMLDSHAGASQTEGSFRPDWLPLRFPPTQDWSGTRLRLGDTIGASEDHAGSGVFIDRAVALTSSSPPESVTTTFKTAPVRIDAAYPDQIDGIYPPEPYLPLTGCVNFKAILDGESLNLAETNVQVSLLALNGTTYNDAGLGASVCGAISGESVSCRFNFSSLPTDEFYLFRIFVSDGNPLTEGFDQMWVRLDLSGDSDEDGLTDEEEIQFLVDHGVSFDPCVGDLNKDTDGDGLSDYDEIIVYGTSPLLTDTDSDGMPDNWEVLQDCMDPAGGNSPEDEDGDGLTNLEEYDDTHTDPCNLDIDGDGVSDGVEFSNGSNPLDPGITPRAIRLGAPLQGSTGEDAGNPAIVWASTTNGYGLAWDALVSGVSDYREIFFRKVSEMGAPGDIKTISSAGDTKSGTYPSLDWNWSNSEFGLSWMQDGNSLKFARLSYEGNTIQESYYSNFRDYENSSIVWNGSRYGLAFCRQQSSPTRFNIYFTRISSASVFETPKQITSSNWSFVPSLAWNGNEFGVSFRDESSGVAAISFARLSNTGTKIGAEIPISSAWSDDPSLAWSSSDYGLVWEDNRFGNFPIDYEEELYFARISAQGTTLGEEIRLTYREGRSIDPDLVWTGSGFGLAWNEESSAVYFTSLSPSGQRIINDLLVDEGTGVSISNPDLAWSGSEFGLAWHNTEKIMFVRIGLDPDGDGLTDAQEEEALTEPRDWDTDDDLMPDGYECKNTCLDPLTADDGNDPDYDGLSNIIEFHEGTDPCDQDSDNDGLADGAEICDGSTCVYDPIECWGPAGCAGDSDPLNPDTDFDGINDGQDENPIMGLASGASVAFEGTFTYWGRAGSLYRSDPDDPDSPLVPIVITARGEGGSRPRNTLVELTAFEPTNKSPATGQAAGFCADPEDCEPVSPFYAYTDAFGQARAYLVFGAKTYGENPEDDQWGLAGSHYAQVVGITELSVKLMPGTSDEIAVPSSSIPYGGNLYSMADRPAEIRVVAEAFPGRQPFLYASSPGDPIVRVVDRFGNPVANALVEYQVTGGAGKVINRSARECRDNAGDPWAAACNYDESVALQTIEVPDFLDQKLRYGPHYCICHWDEELGTIICPVFLPNKWNVDEQCDSFLWWTDSWGALGADWVLGSEAGQELTVRIMDNNSVTPQVFSGAAIDLLAKEMVPVVLNLSPRVNDSPQYAGVTMAKPFRVAIFYRHDQTERPSAEPLVRVDDDLKTVDKPEGEFVIILEVDTGLVSDFPARREEDRGITFIPLADSAADPTDMAKAFWHLTCDEHPVSMKISARQVTSDNVNLCHFGYFIDYEIVPNPDHCVDPENIRIFDDEDQERTTIPMAPTAFYLEVELALEGGDTVEDSTKIVSIITYDADLNLIQSRDISLALVSGSSKYRSGFLMMIDKDDVANPCLDGSCGEVIRNDKEGVAVIEASGGSKTFNAIVMRFMNSDFNVIIGDDNIINSSSDLDGEENNQVNFEIMSPKVEDGETPPSRIPVIFEAISPNREITENLKGTYVDYVDIEDASYDHYRISFDLAELRGLNHEDSWTDELAVADAGLLDDSNILLSSLRSFHERGIANIKRVKSGILGLFHKDYFEIPSLSRSFFETGGVIGLHAVRGNVSSITVTAANQADILFFSGHGYHQTALINIGHEELFDPLSLLDGSTPKYWNKDLDMVIFSTCSVLDIHNYHAWTIYKTDPSEYDNWLNPEKGGGMTNPGDKWKITGPTYFLGYNWKSPSDNTRWGDTGPSILVSEIFAAYYYRFPLEPLYCWEQATDPNRKDNPGINGSAIVKKFDAEVQKIYYEYWFWDKCTTENTRFIWVNGKSNFEGVFVNFDDEFEQGKYGFCVKPPNLPE